MAKSVNLEPAGNKKDLSRLLDKKVLQVNKLFTGSKFPTSPSFVKILIGVILAFGVLIFFLNTVDLNRLKSQTLSSQDNPPPPPPDVVIPPQPPEDVLNEGNVQGRQTAANLQYDPSYLSGCYDLNGDGKVTTADVELVRSMYGAYSGAPTTATPRYDPKYDLNGDGVIDASDVSMVTAQVGRVCASPTPTTLVPPIISDIQPSVQQCYQGQPRIPFGWGASVGASGYWVEISTSSNFSPLWRVQLPYQVSSDPATYFWWSVSDPLFKDSSGNSHAPESNITYFWRVLAYNQTNQVYSRHSNFVSINCSSSPTPTPLPFGITGPQAPTETTSCAPLRILAMPSSVRGSDKVTVKIGVNGVTCNGKTVWVFLGFSFNYLQSCKLAQDNCSVTLNVPAAPGAYPIVAVADLDGDGNWYESGEYDKRLLYVLRSPIPWLQQGR